MNTWLLKYKKLSALCGWLFLFAINFQLTKAQEIIISDVSMKGNVNIPTIELQKLMQVHKGNEFHQPLLETDIHAILHYYGNKGFPFAAINTDSIQIDSSNSVNVQLLIQEGPRFYIDEIKIEGNTITDKNVISREARLQKGELFNQEKNNRIQKRLERLQLFSLVAEPQLYITSSSLSDSLHGGLLITVKDGSTNTFDGILGYVPNQQTSGGYFTGNIFVAMRNLLGTGRKSMIRWQRETETTQELEFQYQEPWIYSFPMNLNFGYFQRKQDSTYVKSKIDFKLEFSATEELSFAGSVTTETVVPSSTVESFSVFESNLTMYGAEILYDTRDNTSNPAEGVRYATTIQQGKKQITGPEKYLDRASVKNFTVQRLGIDADIFVTTFLHQVIAFRFHGKQITSSQLEFSDLFQIGGTNSIRGYRENQFFASKIVWLNNEYRFLTGRASSLYGFIDVGYFSRPEDILHGIRYQEKTLFGYGIGAKVEAGIGLLSINFALGQGDSFSQGKIHVGLINEF